MFRFIDGTLYVASPIQQKAVRLVRLMHEKKVGIPYLAAITSLFLVSVLGGVAIFTLLFIFTKMRLEEFALGSTALLAGIGIGLALTKGSYTLAHDHQAARLKKYVQRGWVLKLPKVCSDELLLQLEQRECLHFLSYYRPDPYDFGDLTKLVNELGGGSGSPAFIINRVKPFMHKLVNKIHAAMQEQEDGHSYQADALKDLPRPGDFEK